MAQRLSDLIQLTADRSHYAADGTLPPNSPLLAAWDGVALMWEAVMSEAYPIVEANWHKGRGPGATLGVLKECFEAALAFDSADPRLLMSELAVLGALLPCLRLVPEGMPYVLRKLFGAIAFNADRDREEQERTLGVDELRRTGLSDSGQVRRKAGGLLVALCAHPPPCFLEVLQEVIDHIQSLLAQPGLAEMTHSQLVTALAAALNALPDGDLHGRYLAQVFGPTLADWTSAEAAAMVADPARLVQVGGLASPDSDSAESRRSLLTLVATIDLVLQRTQPRHPAGAGQSGVSGAGGESDTAAAESTAAATAAATGTSSEVGLDPALFPSADLARAALDNVFMLCRTLHHLWTPECAPLLPGAMSAVLDLRRSELYANLTHQLENSAVRREMTAAELWLDRTQLWLATLRSGIYGIVQQAARQGVLYESAARIDQARACCLHGVATMQKRHLKLLLRHVLDPIARCVPRTPTAMQHLMPLLAEAYGGIVDAVLAMWERRGTRASGAALAGRRRARAGTDGAIGGEGLQGEAVALGAAAGGGGDLVSPSTLLTAEQREVLEDKLLQDLTDALLKHVGPLVSRTGGEHEDPLASYVMHSGEVALPLLRFLCTTLSLPSSGAAGRAGTVLAKAIGNLGHEPDYKSLVKEHVLPCALQGLGVHGEHAENLNTLLLLVARCLESAGTAPEVRQMLLQVRDATPEAVDRVLVGAQEEAEAARRSASRASDIGSGSGGGGTSTAQRKRRQRLRELLQPIIGINVGQAWKDEVRVRDLPERLFLARMAPPKEDDDDGTGAAIFQTIFES